MDINNAKGFYTPKTLRFDSADADGLCFDELERTLNALLEDSTLLPPEESFAIAPQPSTSSYIFPSPVQEKIDYFKRASEDVMDSKTKFLSLYGSINKEIDEVIEKLMSCLLRRQQELKLELNKVAQSKIAVFDTQLSTCNEVLNKLQIYGLQNFDYIVSNEVIKSLKIHESDDLRFKVPNYPELMCSLQSVGTIAPVSESDVNSIGISPVRGVLPKFVIGGNGSAPGHFCRPWGICTDPTGRIFVCDRSNNRVQIFNDKGGFIMQFGKEGSRPGEFRLPSGIDVDKKNRIIVSDKDNHRIQVFAYNGAYLFSFGKHGERPGQFFYPWDVAVNFKCEIAVGDSKNHRVQLFDENGQFIMLFDPFKAKIPPHCDAKMYGGIRRIGLKVLDSPRGLAFRPDGSLLVTDLNNHHVLLLNPDFDKVTFFGGEGVAPGQFFRPQGIACDRNGHFAVSDCKNYRVQIFDVTGKLIKVFGRKGTEPGEFDCPQGISFSHTNNDILVVDFGNHRVQVF